MPSSKKFTCKGTLRQLFICLRLLPSYEPKYPPYCTRVYCIFIHTTDTRKGGRANQREG